MTSPPKIPVADAASERGVSGTVVAAVLFALVGLGVAYRYWPGEERDIRRHLSNLAEALTTPADSENEAGHATRMAAIREYFAPVVRVSPTFASGPVLATESHYSREELFRTIEEGTPRGSLSVELTEVSVHLAPDGAAADVVVVARVARAEQVGRRQAVEVRRLGLAMTKTDGDWVITAVDERPPEGPAEERWRQPRP